jgi:hypothetical protein
MRQTWSNTKAKGNKEKRKKELLLLCTYKVGIIEASSGGAKLCFSEVSTRLYITHITHSCVQMANNS